MKLHFLFLSLILFIHYSWFSQFWLPTLEILFPSDFPNTKPEILNLFICVVYLKKLSEIVFFKKKTKQNWNVENKVFTENHTKKGTGDTQLHNF